MEELSFGGTWLKYYMLSNLPPKMEYTKDIKALPSSCIHVKKKLK